MRLFKCKVCGAKLSLYEKLESSIFGCVYCDWGDMR